jgi:hypothetical protein
MRRAREKQAHRNGFEGVAILALTIAAIRFGELSVFRYSFFEATDDG